MTVENGLVFERRGENPTRVALAVAWAGEGSAFRLLVARRPPGKRFEGLWEWPGGKIESGESPEQAACRELLEETGVRAHPNDSRHLGLHADSGPPAIEFHVLALHCRQPSPPHMLACVDARWLPPDEALAMPFPPANAAINRLVERWVLEARSEPTARRPSAAR